MSSLDADRYQLADRNISRIGYGAMQLAGDGVFAPPGDRDEALAVLRAAVEAGVDHIDTAQFYGPGRVNELIRTALYPYPDGLALVSKVAARGDDSGAVLSHDEPHQLRAAIEDNLRALGIEQLTAVNLRLTDHAVPDNRFIDQLGAMIQARDEGLIAGIGLSNISLAHLLRALEYAEIVCVQNFFNLADRTSLPILHECVVREIAFVPFCPLGWPRLQHEQIRTDPVITGVAQAHGGTPAQVALAWLLALAPNVLLIPGTSKRSHLAENLQAGTIVLHPDQVTALTERFA